MDLVERASVFSIVNVLARLREAGAMVHKAKDDSQFFFGKFAELSALHILVHKDKMAHNLTLINAFRNFLVERMNGNEETLLYEVACGSRLGATSLLKVATALKHVALVAYSNVYMVDDTAGKPTVAFVLEQGGCRVFVEPTEKVISKIKQKRRGVAGH
jgi:uncharacterized protein YbgA (DUF1722 family)